MSDESGKKNVLIVICGPTAVGKTGLSIELAERFNCEIISTDSRQFYREMNAATAKPTEAELRKVKHHFVNCRSVHEHYSAGQYEQDALQLLRALFERQRIVIAVGGSGLYVKALTEGLDDFPEVQPGTIHEIEHQLGEHGLSYLQDELRLKDPDYFSLIDIHNPRRIIRALGVIRQSGLPFSSFHGRSKPDRPFRLIYLRLDLPRDTLYTRINTRVDDFLKLGLLEEARTLFSYRQLVALQTVGYSEMFDFLEGKYSLEFAIDKIKQHSRNYAKRQITWLNKYVGQTAFMPDDLAGINSFLDQELN